MRIAKIQEYVVYGNGKSKSENLEMLTCKLPLSQTKDFNTALIPFQRKCHKGNQSISLQCPKLSRTFAINELKRVKSRSKAWLQQANFTHSNFRLWKT